MIDTFGKPGPQSRSLCDTVCALSIANNTFTNGSIVSLLIFLFDFEICLFCTLVHVYTLCFTGSPCYNVSYHNYNSVRPYYIFGAIESRW